MAPPLTTRALTYLVTPTDWNDVINAINSMWSTLSTGLKIYSYAPTLSTVSNTTSEGPIVSFSVPAAGWADQEVIMVLMTVLAKNNKGSSGTLTLKINVGAGAQVTIAGAVTATDAAGEETLTFGCFLQRKGSTVVVYTSAGAAMFPGNPWSTRAALGTSTPTNFTGANTVEIKATLSAAHSTFYVDPEAVLVSHLKAA